MHLNSSEGGPLRFRGQQDNQKGQANDLINLEQQPIFQHQRKGSLSSKMKLYKSPHSFFATNWTPGCWVFISLLYLGLMTYIAGLIHSRLPTPLSVDDIAAVQDDSERFVGENAQAYLNSLIKLGPRPVGSNENEVLAPDFLRGEIIKIQKQSNKVQKISTSDQVVTGSFYIKQNVGYVSFYHNVQNIAVRLSSTKRNNTSAVLVNCHYDSVPGSPGASDDGFHCAVMLELLRVLSNSEKPLLHDVIFLFNGAEESGLQASHGFITQHHWARDVKTFINLEACGAGGREVLFQTGPNCPVLVETYASVVPHPHGTVMAEELFQSGIIPSDTDFRIFRDFAHIPGVDFANIDNGFVYHTKFDNGKVVHPGSYQHTGDNVLALVPALANSPHLDSIDQSGGSMVYFDFLGVYLINYSQMFGTVFNAVVALLSLCSIFGQLYRIKTAAGLSLTEVSCMFGYAISATFVGWMISLLYILSLTIFLNWINCTQSWYRSFAYQFCLYYCPTILLCVSVPFFIPVRSKLTNMHQSMMNSLGTQCLWTIILLLGTVFSIRSSYLFLFLVIAPSIANLGLIFCRNYKATTWLNIQLLQTFIPLLIGICHTIMAMTVFIPITNRSGSGMNVELVIGLLSAATCIMCISYLVPLSIFARHISVVTFLAAIHLSGLLVLIVLRPLPFYEWQNGESGVLQRVPLWHVQRHIYDESGTIRFADSGFWMMNMDRSSPYLLKDIVTELASAEKASSFCGTELFCALPLYSPRMSNFLNGSSWIVGPKPFEQPILQIGTQIDESTPLIRRITFTISGPQQMSFMFSPLPGITASGWSLQAELVPSTNFKERPAYFIFYQRGLDAPPWTFHIDFKSEENNKMMDSNHTATVGLAGSYIHPDKFSKEFKDFIQKFPSWAFVSPRASELRIWEL